MGNNFWVKIIEINSSLKGIKPAILPVRSSIYPSLKAVPVVLPEMKEEEKYSEGKFEVSFDIDDSYMNKK